MKMDILKFSAFTVLLLAAIMATWISSPRIIFFFSSTLPQFFVFLQSWLTPPFFFLAVNLIVFLIYRLSNNKFDHGEDYQFTNKHSNSASIIPTTKINKPKIDNTHEVEKIEHLHPEVVSETKEGTVDQKSYSDLVATETNTKDVVPVAVAPSSSGEMSGEVSDDSCVTTEGDNEENDGDSMDAMWQTIMSGKRLNKSTTWEKTLERTTAAVATDAEGATASEEAKNEMRKSRTYREGRQRDKTNDAAWRGREALLEGHEELNKKFENFIKKSYEQMRNS